MLRLNLWIGRFSSALVVLFLLFDCAIHFMKIAPVVNAFAELGFPVGLAPRLGAIELVCILLYAVPPTSVLGAILLTGYLGGAVATQMRVGNPLVTETLFPVYLGVLLWGGLFLRDSRLRSLIPRRTPNGR